MAMPPRMLVRKSGKERDHTAASGGRFAPGEFARLVGAPELNYRQFDELLALVKVDDDRRRRGCPATLSFRDLVALRTAFELAGGTEAIHAGRNLRYTRVAKACQRLREEYGVNDPLVEVRLEREGARVIAVLDGVRFEVTTGQVVMALRDRAQSGDPLIHADSARKVVKGAAKSVAPTAILVELGTTARLRVEL